MSMTREPPIDEREWQAQERGMRAAPGDDTDVADSRTVHYRVVAQALRSTPCSQPPADFASSVARLALTHGDAGLERTLSKILLVVFAVSSLVVVALYGGRWWQSVHQAVGDNALAWLLVGMVCLVLSWVFGQLRILREDNEWEAAR